jgi:hypothetical protein
VNVYPAEDVPRFPVTKEPTPRSAAILQAEVNWKQVDEKARLRAVKSLKNYLESELDRELLDKWREQYKEGMAIGSDDPWFHFGTGTMIRNILRLEISENNLPWVEYPGGKQYRNWDDFYTAALREALGLAAA